MRTKLLRCLEILEKKSKCCTQFYSGNDNGNEGIVDLFTGSVAGNVPGFIYPLCIVGAGERGNLEMYYNEE